CSGPRPSPRRRLLLPDLFRSVNRSEGLVPGEPRPQRRGKAHAVLAGITLLAALAQPSPLSLRFEASYLQPANDAVARGLGAGLGASYRLTDQISVVASAAQNVVWTQNGQPAGAPRGSRSLSLFSAGAQAVLDATPIAPFLEATLVDLAPKAVAGYAIAARIGFGADWA